MLRDPLRTPNVEGKTIKAIQNTGDTVLIIFTDNSAIGISIVVRTGRVQNEIDEIFPKGEK